MYKKIDTEHFFVKAIISLTNMSPEYMLMYINI